MSYDFSVSLAMIFFNLVILLNLTLNYGELDRYHRDMQRAFLFLTLSAATDTLIGIGATSFQEGGRQVLWIILMVLHVIVLVIVLQYLLAFFSQMKRPLPLLLLLPILFAFFFFHYMRPQLMVFTAVLSAISFAVYFLTELPLYEQLEERLDELTLILQQAEEAEGQAKKEDLEKNDFLANMSHEIRTPLNSILGMNEMILREAKEDGVLGYAHVIEGAGDNLLAIVNDILDFSRIESGDMQLNEENYHLGRVLETVQNMIALKASDKGLQLHTDIDETLPDILKGDELRVTQVLTNLLSNAVKYTQQGSVTLRLTGTERTKDAVTLCAEVIDTGIGISEENLPRLFDTFTRFDEERNKAIEGTGLGLTITHNLVQLMNGEIRVESVYGKGSTFTALLPQRIAGMGTLADYRREEEEERSGEGARFAAPDAHVLVVDDTKINLRVVEMLLKQTQLQVTTCMSGAEALALLEDHTYDIILLDHMMPEMDGIETLHRMRKMEQFDASRTKVIALTANAVAGAREEYLSAGFDDYLSKPVEPVKLEDMLKKYLPEDKIR